MRSAFCDKLVFYFSTISWLRLQQETMWVNINFERRDLTPANKSHPSSDNFGEPFALTLIKKNVMLLPFFCAPEKLKFQLLQPGTVSLSTS